MQRIRALGEAQDLYLTRRESIDREYECWKNKIESDYADDAAQRDDLLLLAYNLRLHSLMMAAREHNERLTEIYSDNT